MKEMEKVRKKSTFYLKITFRETTHTLTNFQNKNIFLH